MLIWERPERAARGPRPSRSREEIARVAVLLADTEGLDAVSMRRVAGELGTGTTSLYRYVSKKDELFDLMLDRVLGESPLPPLTGNWRADLRAFALRMRTMMLRHPWAVALSAGRPTLGPNSLRASEHALTAVDGLGLHIDDMMIVVDTLQAFVRGAVMRDLEESQAQRRSGLDFRAYIKSQADYGLRVVASGQYPRMTRYWVEAEIPHAADRAERTFTLGLERLLDGLSRTIRAD
ncbi:TetR/AcrR family transcriptional regulator [Kutzneria albida]|uniref:HTH tetR-type domain-containing protein n=1 Tax=Kutzneria albida DSM 43870 TaxID=1449976 RepID=W5W2J5_9PSEU|nr:TetR/AcrR family transcriptional regulator [Kutzneria albida]AHH94701.1 hypothetical protein KALB_1328 [Kutzneria albida DSM 43870]